MDQSRAGIGGVRVVVQNRALGLTRVVTTDTSGAFLLASLPVAGPYEITASKEGFAEARLDHVDLLPGTTAELILEMSVAAGKAQVTVTGVAGEVRTDEPQLGQRLDAAQVQELPLLDRKITYLPLLSAANRQAINQGDAFMNQDLFTTNGSGRRQAAWVVDGGSGNDSWGRQTIFSAIPLDAVQETTILENAFSAEFGATTGAVVNIVTKSGGDSLHGDAVEAWRPSATEAALSGFSAANASSGNDLINDTLGQSAASIGGPLDAATRVLAAGEFTRESRASPVVSPIQPGNFIGHYKEWLGLLRMDRQISSRNSAFLRSNLEGFYDTNPNGSVGGQTLPTVDRVFRKRTYTEELGETAVLTPSVVNVARLEFGLASPITEFEPVIYGTEFQLPVSTGGTFTTGTSQSALLMNRQYQASDTLSMVRGKHQIRIGADSVTAHTGGNSKEFGGPIYLGEFIYKVCTQPLAACESAAYLNNIANVASYTQSYGNASYTVNDTLWSVFAQDDYHVRPDLTVNLGLRYERQTFTDSRHDFGPRVGFAYNVRGDGKTVLRGGFGIYDSQIQDNAEANYALTGPQGVFNYTATPGQIGFPASVQAAPLVGFPAGAVAPLRSLYIRPGDSAYLNHFLPTATLIGYPNALLNPYSQQWTFGLERRLKQDWVLTVDYVGAHTLRINRPLDVDPPAPFIRTAPGQARSAQAANCTRPYWIWWYGQHGMTCSPNAPTNPQPPYAVIQSDVNDGYAYYDALNVNLSRRFSRKLWMLASYTWSHAIDNVDPDVTSQNPNDPNFTGKVENGNAIFDQRHRFVLSGTYMAPLRIMVGGIATLASGLPYNITTGVNNSGDTGATTDRPVVSGAVIGRNAGIGRPIYDFSPFVERAFTLPGERLRIVLRTESFNALNHANFVGYSGTWGNVATPGPGFGQPLAGITNQLPTRSVQFEARVEF